MSVKDVWPVAWSFKSRVVVEGAQDGEMAE